jgi:outer membrane lipoprotein carrier protein
MTVLPRLLRGVLLLGLCLGSPLHAAVAPPTALDRYLDGLSSWSARFTQQVTDSRNRVVGRGSGSLLVLRPGRFRWELAPLEDDQAGQLLVADGRNLWFLDRDLQQVTVKPLDQALSQTPAVLLAGTADVRAAFNVKAMPRAEGLDWVEVRPRSADADFRTARLGFAGTDLRRMVLEDKLGQRSTLEFTQGKRNAPVDAATLQFVVPPGVDLIGKPLP